MLKSHRRAERSVPKLIPFDFDLPRWLAEEDTNKHSQLANSETLSCEIGNDSLVTICLKEIVQLLAGADTSHETKVSILELLPTVDTIKTLWQIISRRDSNIYLYWLLQNSPLVKGDLMNLFSEDTNFIENSRYQVALWKYRKRNRQSSCFGLNDIHFCRNIFLERTFQFLTVVECQTSVGNLELLTRLEHLDALRITGPRTEEVETIVRAWYSYLKLYPETWRHLRVLSIPDVVSLRLLYDAFQLMKSLVFIESGVKPQEIKEVKMLNAIISYKPELDYLTQKPRPKLETILQELDEFIKYDPEVKPKVMFHWDFTNFSTNHMRNKLYFYFKNRRRPHQDKIRGNTSETNKPKKKPRFNSIRGFTSANSFFGMP
ncbi:hypothetical protein KAFR_0G00420 [Kazachstania africana CBS 2517]|uniref:Uncharacterized protein n=1 Tax=Kazachstania africana (strain ATCC 22294 / BCRC 22015 / CBS 2517 / CECT 1963 / NBRC 1671 / NRRL Y-8276) TaxID=1071382 RepID=H2AXH5_KAZAF|nr:hypothetical protein KAFR_0G00420 [Kazachstania africana CBS 2517]CCF59075.1 hypothetical protein KAFR_0G00420 [Kazachstania africana CBS 2517]